jgi:hypothetical protein
VETKLTSARAASVPASVRKLLGPPPLLFEKEADYWDLVAVFAEFAGPTDPLAWLLIKDLVDSRIEIARWRKCLADLPKVPARLKNQVSRLDTPFCEDTLLILAKEELRQIADGVSLEELERREAASHARMAAMFAQWEADKEAYEKSGEDYASSEDGILDCYAQWIEGVKQFDALLRSAEERFQSAYLLLEKHLNGLGRRDWKNIIDGEVVRAARKPRNVGRSRSSNNKPGLFQQ